MFSFLSFSMLLFFNISLFFVLPTFNIKIPFAKNTQHWTNAFHIEIKTTTNRNVSCDSGENNIDSDNKSHLARITTTKVKLKVVLIDLTFELTFSKVKYLLRERRGVKSKWPWVMTGVFSGWRAYDHGTCIVPYFLTIE